MLSTRHNHEVPFPFLHGDLIVVNLTRCSPTDTTTQSAKFALPVLVKHGDRG